MKVLPKPKLEPIRLFSVVEKSNQKSISVAKGVIWQPKKQNEIGCNDSENKFLQPI